MMHFEPHTSIPDAQKFPFAFDSRFSVHYARLNGSQFHCLSFQGSYCGYIPVAVRKHRWLTTAQLLCFPCNSEGKRFDPSGEREILEALVVFLAAHFGIHRIVQGVNWALFDSYPKGAVYCNFGTYALNLENKTPADLMAAFHTKHRNVIRNAEKQGAEVKTGKEQIGPFYGLYKATMKRNGMGCEPVSYFYSISDVYPDFYCGVVYIGNEPQGAIFAPYSAFGAYYLYGASADVVQLTGAVNYLHYRFICFLVQNHIPKYDFVGARLSTIAGTKYEGIQRFKERFGGRLERGYLWKMDVRPWRCRFYDLMLRLKLKLKGAGPLLDIIDQERAKGFEKPALNES